MAFSTRLLAGAAVLGLLGSALPAAAQDTLAVASYGGAYQEGLRKGIYTPTEEALGITIKDYTLSSIADLRTRVRAGSVEWDVVELYAGQCEQAAQEGLTMPLDYGVIDADGIPAELIRPNWVGFTAYSTVLAWNTEVYGDNPPKNWADFWDVEAFPGARALNGISMTSVAEYALMADGVPPSELYPLDLDRAFASLETIKPHVEVFWKSGAQATQLAVNQEVDMLPIWAARIDAAIAEGAPFAYTYEQAILDVECLVVPVGAPNPELAMKAIDLFISPDFQANLPAVITYGPINQKAFTTGKITPEMIARSNSSPENLAKQVILDKAFWVANGQAAQERWDAFMQ